MPGSPTPCARCGCPHAMHEHWRPGSDCGRCGRDRCRTYRRIMPGHDLAVLAWMGGCFLYWWLGRDEKHR